MIAAFMEWFFPLVAAAIIMACLIPTIQNIRDYRNLKGYRKRLWKGENE